MMALTLPGWRSRARPSGLTRLMAARPVTALAVRLAARMTGMADRVARVTGRLAGAMPGGVRGRGGRVAPVVAGLMAGRRLPGVGGRRAVGLDPGRPTRRGRQLAEGRCLLPA